MTSKPARESRPGGNAIADRAVDLLLMFQPEKLSISAPEVAERLGISRSAAYRYLQTFRVSGLIEEVEEGGRYRLGPRILELALLARRGLDLATVARPTMNALAAQIREAVLLTRRVGDRVVCVEIAQSPQPIRISYEVGHVLPLHAGASAQVLLAWLDQDQARELLTATPLPRFTSRTLTSPSALMRRLSAIRAQGYALSNGEVDEHVLGVAAPVYDSTGAVVAGLSVAALEFRVAGIGIDALTDLVVRSAEELSIRLGAPPVERRVFARRAAS